MRKTVAIEYLGGASAGTVELSAFEQSDENAFPTSRVLDGSRDHGAAEEWVQPGTAMVNGERVAAQEIYLFDADEISDDAENYPWDDEHVARIVIVE